MGMSDVFAVTKTADATVYLVALGCVRFRSRQQVLVARRLC